MTKLSVGLEPHAMCYDRQKAAQTQLQLAGTAALAPGKSASYWACQGALAQHCDTAFNSVPRDKCMSCAHDHLSELLNNGCSVDLIAKACSEPHGCTDAMQASCGKSGTASACRKQNQTACKECEQCGFRSPLTSAANCSFELLYESCGDYSHGHHHRSIYDEWMGGLACLADGNWYSTQSVSECQPDDNTGANCWWRRRANSPAKGKRMINATCADNRVTAALRQKNPSCWEACGPEDAANSTSLCSVSCLFTTMLGNETLGTKPMTKTAVVQPFIDAFKPESQGGCPDAVPATRHSRAMNE